MGHPLFRSLSKFNPLSLVFTDRCLCCNSLSTNAVCRSCWDALEPLERGCARCGNPQAPTAAEHCWWCQRLSVVGDFVWSPFAFRGVGRDLFHLVKFHYYWRLIDELVNRAFQARPVTPQWFSYSQMAPIPETVSRMFRRPFDPATAICRSVSNTTAIEICPILTVNHLARHQVGLDLKERRANMRRRFKAKPNPPNSVILIDDVLTSGATLEAATLALKKAGVRHVAWATLFRTL